MTSSGRVRYVHGTESRLWRGSDGRVRSSRAEDWYESYLPLLGTFDTVVVVARVSANESENGRLVEGARVSVSAVPDFRGLVGYLRRRAAVRRPIADAFLSADGTVFGGRLPGLIGGVIAREASRRRRPFIAHVVGDAGAVLTAGAAGKAGRMLAPMARRQMLHQVASSQGAVYVSNGLRDAYPVGRGRPALVEPNFSPAMVLADVPREVALPPDAIPKLVAVGTHEQRYKGHDLLIRAIARLNGYGIQVRAELVGQGHHHAELVELARQAGVADRIRFTSALSPEQIVDLLDGADLFIMPSRTEGTPRALIEAMARGGVAIGSDVGGIPELLDQSALFRPDDIQALTTAIQHALADIPWRADQARRNLETAERLLSGQGTSSLAVFLREAGKAF